MKFILCMVVIVNFQQSANQTAFSSKKACEDGAAAIADSYADMANEMNRNGIPVVITTNYRCQIVSER